MKSNLFLGAWVLILRNYRLGRLNLYQRVTFAKTGTLFTNSTESWNSEA
ncbi:hypothetical protein DESC_210002 [Desulfosarcina cetonica]|nr:hypothetical protein DESC_210002 [Desulfosarcina cetonica]